MTAGSVEYPDLRIASIGKVIPHELHDEQRARPLVNRLKADGILKSPILVTTLEEKDAETDYIILDGTNRSIALDLLGVGDALIQVVPYREPHVKLLTWNHAICGIYEAEVIERMSATQGLTTTLSTMNEAIQAFSAGQIQAYCRLKDNRAIILSGHKPDLASRSQYLQGIVASYIRDSQVNRVRSDNYTQLKDLYPDLAGIVVFPLFTPEEILDLVRYGLRVPAGITRHLINGRALRINYPLSELSSAESLEVKNKRLMDWMQAKFSNKEARFYGEPTFLFDE